MSCILYKLYIIHNIIDIRYIVYIIYYILYMLYVFITYIVYIIHIMYTACILYFRYYIMYIYILYYKIDVMYYIYVYYIYICMYVYIYIFVYFVFFFSKKKMFLIFVHFLIFLLLLYSLWMSAVLSCAEVPILSWAGCQSGHALRARRGFWPSAGLTSPHGLPWILFLSDMQTTPENPTNPKKTKKTKNIRDIQKSKILCPLGRGFWPSAGLTSPHGLPWILFLSDMQKTRAPTEIRLRASHEVRSGQQMARSHAPMGRNFWIFGFP